MTEYQYIHLFTLNFLLFHHHPKVKSMEFYDDLHDIYDLVTLGDEDVINNKPHFPKDEIPYVASDLRPVAATSDENLVEDKPLAPKESIEPVTFKKQDA